MQENPLQQSGRELYQCGECGVKYSWREWAEKCEVWCKEHHSCNIEITAHAVSPDDESNKNEQLGPELGRTEGFRPEDAKFLTRFFYGLIGIVSSLAFFLALYWALRLDSSIASVIASTYDTPAYFWPYVILTLGTIALFGVNASLFVYRSRKFGRSRFRAEAGAGGGLLVGILSSACPVCGSTILYALGVFGGLAVFPLQGLELKALSFGLMALPVWLIRRDLKKLEFDCVSGACPMPQDHSFKEKDRPWLVGLLTLTAILMYAAWGMLKTDPMVARLLLTQSNEILNASDNKSNILTTSSTDNKFFDEITAKVFPEKGFQSKIRLGEALINLVENGVIDRAKLEAIYEDRGGLPDDLKDALTKPSNKQILLTRANASYYVNLLWPLGLANNMTTNERSPILGESLFNFASTGGWNLGKEENGGAYFNKFKIVELTPAQEALVTRIAESSYRPCCNNSTFYQDCNHGSALLGLLQLGAAQGLSEDELWREAMAFNSFWFPHNYIQTALYFKAVKNTDWDKVDPKVVMGKDFSSISGWSNTVAKKVNELGLLPQQKSGASCGV